MPRPALPVAPAPGTIASRDPGSAPRDVLGWAGPLAAAGLGAVLRLWQLGRPHALVFDETYYAKDALSLVRYGAERRAVEGADDILLQTRPSVNGAEVFTSDPSFVVHPPLGKWLIGLGELMLGVNPIGWRIAAAVAGVLSILLLGRIVRRLTGSSLLGTIAAALLALDGLHLVLSRTAVLDGFLMLFVLAAFGALLLDRDRTRAERLAPGPTGWRPWRVCAGVLLGLACAVKWSGLWYVAAFGLLSVAWDAGSRRAAGSRHPWRSALLRDAAPAFIAIVVVAAAVYLAAWSGWLLTDDGWGRQAEGGPALLPQPLQALLQYHASIYRFHVGLSQEHPYEAPAWGWLLQLRPTSLYYDGDGSGCGAEECSAAIVALGNPLIWWAALPALLHQAYRAAFVRDWRASAVVVAVLAGWAPWLLLPERTTFTFYAVVLAPFLVAALTMSLGQILGTGPVAGRRARIALVGGFLAAVVLAAWWFFPVWSGDPIPYQDWRLRMWLRTWI